MHPIIQEDAQAIIASLGDLTTRFAGKTILLVGSQGFLGQTFLSVFKALVASGKTGPSRVICLDNLLTSTTAPSSSEDGRIRFVHHDIREPLSVPGEIDFIIHSAGVASPFYYRKFPVETIEVATLGTKNILDLARETGARVLYFSSSEIYGDPVASAVPTTEDYRGNVATIGPRACYDESKRLGETLCHVYAATYGVENVIVRPFNVYGPGMRETDYRVLPNFATALKTRTPLPVYASGQQTRTYCYVSDAVQGFLRALLLGKIGNAYNIGNPDPEISVLELVELIESVLGHAVPHERIDYPASYPADEPQRRCPDIGKARSDLGYEPGVDIRTGLKRYFDWTADVYVGRAQV